MKWKTLIILGTFLVIEGILSLVFSTAQDPLSMLGRLIRIIIGTYLILNK